MRVLIFGDSITQGFWDAEYGGWVQRVRRLYDKTTLKNMAGDWLELFNLGISGDTTAGLSKRLSYEVETRRWLEDPLALVLAIGLNDTIFRGEELVSTPENYAEELDVLVSAAEHYTDKILLVGLTPVDDKLCNPWVYSSSGKCFKNERILKFEQTLRKYCLGKKLPHVQVFEAFQEGQQVQSLLADGLHPNDAGHQLIADLVKPELDKLLRP